MSTNFTVAEDIYNKIEELILSGNLKKGEIISENMFSNMFNVSRTPVREAVKRLEQENLVGYDFHKNLTVLGVSKQAVANIESEHNKPSIEFISKLIENLGVNSNWYITGNGDMFNALEFEDVRDEVLEKVDEILIKYGIKK